MVDLKNLNKPLVSWPTSMLPYWVPRVRSPETFSEKCPNIWDRIVHNIKCPRKANKRSNLTFIISSSNVLIYESKSNVVWLNFSSDASIQLSGFSATWETLILGNCANKTLRTTSGRITSPGTVSVTREPIKNFAIYYIENLPKYQTNSPK